MANGSTKPIKDVVVTDKVATTDPKTGATEAKPVTALHANQDHDLTDVTVRAAGSRGPVVLHTTQHHPLWDQTASRWVLAADLVAGHALHADGREVATVVAVRNYADGGGRDMRDLTVADVHTYYVIAGTTPVLVHNCNTIDPSEVKFSQKGVSQNFKDGRSVTDLADSLRNGDTDPMYVFSLSRWACLGRRGSVGVTGFRGVRGRAAASVV